MKTRSLRRVQLRRTQAGYALIMVMGMTVLLVASSLVAMQNMVTEGKREREAETIWRGGQYMRAIRLYYRKTGHFPQNLDDLNTGLPELHFLRRAHGDPMNKEDGEWRPIYVNAAGQIIGSVRYASLQQMLLIDVYKGQAPPTWGVAAARGPSQTGGVDTSASNQSSSFQSLGSSGGLIGGSSGGLGQLLGGAQNEGSGSSTQNAPVASASPSEASNVILSAPPTGPVDGSVIGGLLIGVGSKVDRPSVRIYKGGKSYKQWEFIWNPLEDQARAVQSVTGQFTQTSPNPGAGNSSTSSPAIGNPNGSFGSSGNGNSPFQ